MEIAATEAQLKEAIKAALVEVLQERQDLLYDAVERAIEDIAFARAIEEGDKTELIERDEVFGILEGQV
jgi:hypothetical protein